MKNFLYFSTMIGLMVSMVCTSFAQNSTKVHFNEEEIYKQAQSAYDAAEYEEALSLLRPAADRGAAKAQNLLGTCYYEGKGVNRDLELSALWYRRSAEQGYAPAQNNLAYAYLKGEGVEKNISKALYWCENAIKQDYEPANYTMGLIYGLAQKDYVNAAKYYRKAAESGNSDAMVNLGTLYERGYGVPMDYEKAYALYFKAAQDNNYYACYNLGLCYQYGRGKDIDLTKAVYWYKKAEEAGGDQNGLCFKIGYILFTINDGECFSWLKRASESGNLIAEIGVGVCYAKGLGTEKNIDKAVEIFQKAARVNVLDEGENEESRALLHEYSTLGHMHLSYLCYNDSYSGLSRREAINYFWSAQNGLESYMEYHWFLSDNEYNAILEDYSKSAFFESIGGIASNIDVGIEYSKPSIPTILWPEEDVTSVIINNDEEVQIGGVYFALENGQILFSQYGHMNDLCETGSYSALEDIVPDENFNPDSWISSDDDRLTVKRNKGFLFRFRREDSPCTYCRIFVNRINKDNSGSIQSVELLYQMNRIR